jgi:hypothetical protein
MLVKKTDLELSDTQLDFLDDFNRYNMETRYPNEKLTFYKMCTKEFTEEKFKLIEEMYLWLKSRIV